MTKPNVIFLDIDGVLCNAATCRAMGDTKGTFSYLDPISLSLLKRLLIETGSKLVISSTWRIHFDRDAMKHILGAAYPGLGQFIWEGKQWCTENFSSGARGLEINAWIGRNSKEFNRFVILDDNGGMSPLEENWVQTDWNYGLQFEHYKIAKMILDGTKELEHCDE